MAGAPDEGEDDASVAYREARRHHWDSVAKRFDVRPGWGKIYHRRLANVYGLLVPPGARVLELGCGTGELLAALKPSVGVGVDLSAEMIRLARNRYPHLRWLVADAHDVEFDEVFDFVILSDLVNDLWDVQRVLDRLKTVTTSRTRIILNVYSRMWEPILGVAQQFGLSKPALRQNWLTVDDLKDLLELADARVIRAWSEVLCPLPLPFFGGFANRYLVRFWPFRHLALTNMVVAQPRPCPAARNALPTVSVIVPARNEAGNIKRILASIPRMGRSTEIIFVEGHSTDETYATIEREIAECRETSCRLFRQNGRGKGDAVRLGFEHAQGDILMIFDADLTVPPQDLVRFYEAIRSGQGEFINGVRLVYPMEQQAMRFLNLVGNKCFSLAFSWLLGQPIKDTLCGTKVLWRQDYQRIASNRAYFGDFDPFGDFDLLFGAAKLSLRIVQVPIRYRERTYGTTNIQRWRHGWLLLKMVAFAARRIKFA